MTNSCSPALLCGSPRKADREHAPRLKSAENANIQPNPGLILRAEPTVTNILKVRPLPHPCWTDWSQPHILFPAAPVPPGSQGGWEVPDLPLCLGWRNGGIAPSLAALPGGPGAPLLLPREPEEPQAARCCQCQQPEPSQPCLPCSRPLPCLHLPRSLGTPPVPVSLWLPRHC